MLSPPQEDFVILAAVAALVFIAQYVSSGAYTALWFKIALERAFGRKYSERDARWAMIAVWTAAKWSLLVGWFLYLRRVAGTYSSGHEVYMVINILTLCHLWLAHTYLRILSSEMHQLQNTKGTFMAVFAWAMVITGLVIVGFLIVETVVRPDNGYYGLCLALYGFYVLVIFVSTIYMTYTGTWTQINYAFGAYKHIQKHGVQTESDIQQLHKGKSGMAKLLRETIDGRPRHKGHSRL